MRKIFNKYVSIIISIFMILSCMTVFAEPAGVTGLTAKRSSNSLTLSWTNPTDADFSYNEVYKTYDGQTTLLSILKNGETSITTDVTNGGHYLSLIHI